MRLAGFTRSCRTFRRGPNQTHNAAILSVFIVAASLLPAGCRSAEGPREEPVRAQPPTPIVEALPPKADEVPKSPAQPVTESADEISLFDGQTLGQWKPTDFGGQGAVYVKDGAIYMEMGSYMTGITWTGPVVRMNYEITLEAMRVQGNDFFCGLTFPVGEKPCTLVLGGWGGSICGLSNIDYYDASENPTTRVISFEKDKWYYVRLRVEPDRIRPGWMARISWTSRRPAARSTFVRRSISRSRWGSPPGSRRAPSATSV